MAKEKAVHYFKGKERYNCGQAVLKAFQASHDVSDEEIKKHKAFGGGKAPGGVCGALYAAETLLPDPQKKEEMRRRFVEKAGSYRCKEIRKMKLVSCKECVYNGACILEELS